MKRYISILTLLLAAVGAVCPASGIQYWALSTHRCEITDWDGEKLDFESHDDKNGGYYHISTADYGVTDLNINASGSISANELEGLCFKGWYTKADGWTSADANVGQVDTCLETSPTIIGATIERAGIWRGRPLIVAKYVAERTIAVGLSTFGRGTVTVSPLTNTYTKGDSVTLSAQPAEGYAFVRWSDGNGENPRKLILDENLDLRAYIEPKSILVTFKGGAGALLDMDRKRVSYNCAYGELATCTRVGYSFAGWYTMPDGGSKIESTTPVLVTDAQTLYARWTANSYKVTFDSAGGTAVTGSRDVTYDSTYGTLPSCTRTGYTFAGWWTAASEGTKVETSTKVAITEAQTLFAHWTPNEYSLTVSPNGGRYAGQNIDCELSEKLRYDAKACNAIDVATRENYTLLGYYATSGGGARLYDANGHNVKCDYWTAGYPNGTFKGTSALRVYALWSPNDSAVNLDKQGGAGGTDSVTVKYDAMVPAIASLPTRTGYAFEGYYTVKNGGGRKYYNANGEGLEKWTSSGTTVLYANWTPYGYKVGYEFDGGTPGSDAPSSAKVGTAFRVSAPTRKGHAFAGWNVTGGGADYGTAKWGVASDSAATSVTNGTMACFDPSKDYVYFLDLATAKDVSVTLKANWTPVEYSLTVNPNGGTYRGTTGSTTLNEKLFYGATNLNEIGAAERKGYALQDYSTEPNGGESVYDEKGRSKSGTFWTASSPDGTYKGTKDLRVYARWTANTYKVTFDANGGTSSKTSQDVTYDSTYKTLPTPTRAGYTFAGWWTERDDGSRVAETTPVAITEAQTLYAHWTANEYTVTFNANGGETPIPASRSVTYDSPYGDLAVCERTGHTFAGWWTDPNGGTEVKDNTIVKITGSQTLHAHWTANRYTVTFDENGGDAPSIKTNVVTYGSTYGTLATCTKTGYDFAGWWTEEVGGTEVKSGTTVAITSAQTLYAHWTAKTYTVTFDAAGGSASSTSGRVTYDSTYGELPVCTRTGYGFDGWYTSAGEKVGSGTKVTITAAQTLYAHWTANTYEVTFDANGGAEPSFGSTNVTYDATYGTLPTCERTGYAFTGWYTTPGGGTKIEAATKVAIVESQTLYAHWTANTYTVTVSPNGGIGGSTSSYTFSESGQRTMTIALPTKTGYSISAWTVTGAQGGEPTVLEEKETKLAIPAGTYGDLTLKPTWTAKTYTVTINLKDGEAYEDELGRHTGKGMYVLQEPLVFDATNVNQVSVPVKSDYSIFQGYKVSDGTLVYDAQGRNLKGAQGTYWTADYPNGTYCHDGNIELTATWTDPRPRYEITVASASPTAGSVNVEAAGTYVEGSNVVLTATANAGYSFAHWTRDGELVSTDNPYAFAAKASAQYTAVFTGNVYTVAFNGMGGEPMATNIDVIVGEKWGSFVPEVTRSKHKFLGWYADYQYREDSLIDTNGTVSVVSPSTTPPSPLYAKWEELPPVVTFVDPLNSANTISVEREKGQPIGTAPDETKSWDNDGYWRDKDSDWDPPLTTIVTGDMTVSAKWTSLADVLDCSNLTFKVYEGNWRVNHGQPPASKRGESWMQLDSCSGKDVVSVEITEPGMMVFHYKGANLTAKGFGDQDLELPESSVWSCATGLVETATVAKPAIVEFTCIKTGFKPASLDWVTWIPRREMTYGVKVVSEDELRGTVTKNPVQESYVIGSSVMISATPHAGYAFEKWSDGSLDPNQEITVAAQDAVYTASFTACVYRVTLLYEDGASGSTNICATYGEDLPNLGTLPQLAHNTFLGFFDEKEGGVKYYNADGTGAAKWDKASGKELFAHWKEDGQCALTVESADMSRGTVTKDPSLNFYYVETPVGIMATPNEGYAFAKWSDGSTESNRTVTVSSNATYTASFTACVYRVEFEANGGVQPEPQAKDIAFGGKFGTLASTAKEGYEFAGWWTESSGGTEVTSDSDVTTTGNQTLYAHWKEIKAIDPIARALDCEGSGLTFAASGGWSVFTNQAFAKEGLSCLSNATEKAELTMTVSQSGKLTFWWKADGGSAGANLYVTKDGDDVKFNPPLNAVRGEVKGWKCETVEIDVTTGSAEIVFESWDPGLYTALDHFTWTPDGE